MKKPILTSITDGFKNIMKGLGGTKDPRTSTIYQMGTRVDQQTANNLYVYNWIAAKGINIPIDDATRKWREILISDPDKKKIIETSMAEFEEKNKINLAAKWARVFGGAVIIAIIDGDDQEEPLDLEKIRPGTLKNFIVLDRYNIYPENAQMDIMNENFGNPEHYTVVRGGQRIHQSRLVKFFGDIPTINEYEQNNYWGNSVFTRTFETIQDSQVTSQSIADLIYESNVDVYRIDGLNAAIAEGQDDLVVKRLKIASEMKSIINGIALDKEDDYEKKTNTFTTLPDIDDRFMQKVCGAFDIPLTRFLGVSPSGMNATGESDLLNYHDNIQSIQENDIRPKLDWMDSIILASSGFKDQFEYKFNPLKQLTETEQADVDLKRAQRDQIYLDQDVINIIDVVSQLSKDGVYVSIDENRVEEEKQNEELTFEEGNEDE